MVVVVNGDGSCWGIAVVPAAGHGETKVVPVDFNADSRFAKGGSRAGNEDEA